MSIYRRYLKKEPWGIPTFNILMDEKENEGEDEVKHTKETEKEQQVR